MEDETAFNYFYCNEDNVYNENIRTLNINEAFLRELGVDCCISQETLSGLESGCLKFSKLFQNRNLTSPKSYRLIDTEITDLEVHNYTGLCPTNVLEVNPSSGSCSISCLYCLVTDGDQIKPIIVHENYPELVARELERHKQDKVFFYFSPKTDAFSEPLLNLGISHKILRTFIEHYQQNPGSKPRLFIATKAGRKNLEAKFEGDSVFGLLEKLGKKVQFNSSIGIMPDYLREVLEPNAASFDERIDVMKKCQDAEIFAFSVLTQPVIPCYMDLVDSYIKKMAGAWIENIKPEFLTVNMENMAIVSQYINHFDKNRLKSFLELYISKKNQDHRKQRCRTAPDRTFSLNGIMNIIEKAREYGISVSICNWVKSQLPVDISDSLKLAESRGYKCLGYQEKMFDN